MSNPGVITLTQTKIGKKSRFRVEDNLGESIHFHYNDLRVDLSIPELLYLGEEADKVIYDRVNAPGFSLDDLDGDTLMAIADKLIDLTAVEKITVPLSSLYTEEPGFLHLPVWKKLSSAVSDTTKDPVPIVLFNDQPIIRYGKAYARQRLKNGQIEIEAIRLTFKDNKYSLDRHPWIAVLFHWDKARIIRILKTVGNKLLG